DVALRTLDGEVFAVGNFAADLHAAVALAVLEADLKGQFKVLVFLLAAQEGVELQTFGRRRADEGAVLYAPVFIQSFPAFQVLAVEEGTPGCVITMNHSQRRQGARTKDRNSHSHSAHGVTPGSSTAHGRGRESRRRPSGFCGF